MSVVQHFQKISFCLSALPSMKCGNTPLGSPTTFTRLRSNDFRLRFFGGRMASSRGPGFQPLPGCSWGYLGCFGGSGVLWAQDFLNSGFWAWGLGFKMSGLGFRILRYRGSSL